MPLEHTFHRLRVAEVRRETAEAVSIRFASPADSADTFAFRAGQYLTLRRDLGGEDVRRNYSLCVSPLDGELRIAVKRIDGGVFSTWVSSSLAEGDEVEVLAPQGRFTWTFDAARPGRYLAIAGGSGITPILSLIKTALVTEPLSEFALFYGNRASASIMFLEELAGLKDRYMARLRIFHFLEDEDDEIDLFNGRLDAARCAIALNSLVDAARLDAAFVCGPEPMMHAAEQALLARGLPADRLLIERFTTEAPSAARAAAVNALAERAAGAKISVVLDGRRARIAFDPQLGSILENVRAAGLPAPYACKGGVCATCRGKVLSGQVEMRVNYALTEEEVAQGYVLTCQAIPTTDNVVVSYDG